MVNYYILHKASDKITEAISIVKFDGTKNLLIQMLNCQIIFL